MTIQVVRSEVLENGGRAIELATEKRSVSIYLGSSFSTVCVKNAMHAAYRGCGRAFHGENRLKAAFASYKDADVKAMIEYAELLSK